MTSMEPSDNEKIIHAFKLDDIKSLVNAPIPFSSVEKYQIISFDITPNQDVPKTFIDMIALAALMFNKMEKQEAAQREYRAAYNPSMN